MDLLQGLTASLVVVLVLLGSLALLRNRGLARFDLGRRPVSARLQSLERLPLTSQHALHLVRVDDRILIVASSPGSCNVIGPIELSRKAEA